MGTPTTVIEKNGNRHMVIGFNRSNLEKLLSL
jgi:hypothetical protein